MGLMIWAITLIMNGQIVAKIAKTKLLLYLWKIVLVMNFFVKTNDNVFQRVMFVITLKIAMTDLMKMKPEIALLNPKSLKTKNQKLVPIDNLLVTMVNVFQMHMFVMDKKIVKMVLMKMKKKETAKLSLLNERLHG